MDINEIIDALTNSIKKEFKSTIGIVNLIFVCVGAIILMDLRNYGFESTITVVIVGLLPCIAIVNLLEKNN